MLLWHFLHHFQFCSGSNQPVFVTRGSCFATESGRLNGHYDIGTLCK